MHVRAGYCTCTFVVRMYMYVYSNLVVTVQCQCLEAVSGLIPDLFTYMYMYVFKCTVKYVVKKTTHFHHYQMYAANVPDLSTYL